MSVVADRCGYSRHMVGRRAGTVCEGVAWLVLASVIALGCVGPAGTAADYRLKARSSARSALSAIATAELAARLVRDKAAFSTYVGVVLDSAERDITSVESTFAAIQPPNASSDQLREDLDKALNAAVSTISSMRIAARRDEWRHLLDAADDLPNAATGLQKYVELPA